MDKYEELFNMFEEFLSIYKIVNRNNISEILKEELKNDPQLFEIYRLSNGENSTRDIAGRLTKKCSHMTVSNLWKRWSIKGIVNESSIKGRYRAVFNLEEYGIECSEE